MVKGVCCICHKNIGGFLDKKAWECEGCKRIFCRSCAPKRKGLITDKPVCPFCGRILR
jgi:hypothetical protein